MIFCLQMISKENIYNNLYGLTLDLTVVDMF